VEVAGANDGSEEEAVQVTTKDLVEKMLSLFRGRRREEILVYLIICFKDPPARACEA
jgi:hypothetical protein